MSRAQIITFAKTLLGSHYLWGSGGDTPDQQNGVYYAQNTVTMAPALVDDDLAPCVFTAWLTVEQTKKWGLYVCAGRCKQVGNLTASVVDPEYTQYMNYLRATDEPLWEPWKGHLSPRVIMGKNIKANYGRPVWGRTA